MEKIQLTDFLDFHFLSNLKISNDANRVIFTDSIMNFEENRYESDLLLVRDNKMIPLTNSHDVRNFIYIDATTILFSSTRSDEEKKRRKNKEEFTSFYKLSLEVGEAIKAFEIPYPVTKISKLSDDEYIVLISYDLRYGELIEQNKKDDMLKMKEDLSLYESVTSIPFVSNGDGYTNKNVSRLYRYHQKTDTLTALTDTSMNVSQYKIDDSKQKILFIATNTIKRPSLKSGLYEVDLVTGSMTTYIPEKEYEVAFAYYYQDAILFIGNKETVHGLNENYRIYVLQPKSNQITMVASPDMSLWNSLGSDCRYGGGRIHKVYNDRFYFIATNNTSSILYSMNDSFQIEETVVIHGSVECFDIVEDTLYFIAMQDSNLQEVYSYDGAIKKITSINQKLTGKYVATPQEIRYYNDGIEFIGWVLLPYDYHPDKKYPAILDIHGGPKTVYSTIYYHEMQVWATMGYFVFFTNPRGSDGRGNDFMDIFGHYGEIDYQDLMTFTDVVCDSYPAIDTTKLGVTGGSYGGFMSNWIVTHTNRFACAATQRSISNWVSFYGTSDIGFYFAEDQLHGNIFDSPEKLWKHSPLKYVKNVKTPTLIIHSDEDYRCPVEQAMQFYSALVDIGVETKMVIFHGENHELSRSGKPKNRVTRLKEISDWMDHYLK